MDFLDSILNCMEKPPSLKKKAETKEMEKKRKERQEVVRKERETLNRFREYMKNKLKNFIKLDLSDDPQTYKLQLKPMNQVFRSIVHEVCEDQEDQFVVHSFGTEDIDRHCVVWKKGYEPSNEEINALKAGEEFNPKRTHSDDDDDSDERSSASKDGKDKCREKYEKIIGENSHGLKSAKIAMPAEKYGMVPIDLKKDSRTIEQVMIEKRTKKMKPDKLSLEVDPDTSSLPEDIQTPSSSGD